MSSLAFFEHHCIHFCNHRNFVVVFLGIYHLNWAVLANTSNYDSVEFVALFAKVKYRGIFQVDF